MKFNWIELNWIDHISPVCHVIFFNPIGLSENIFTIMHQVNGNPIINRDDDVDPIHLFSLISFVIQLDFQRAHNRNQGQWQWQWCDRTTNSDKSSFMNQTIKYHTIVKIELKFYLLIFIKKISVPLHILRINCENGFQEQYQNMWWKQTNKWMFFFSFLYTL